METNKGYKSIVETHIEEIISQTDFKGENFDIEAIKKQIKDLTGAVPSIQVAWKTLITANEDKLIDDQGKRKSIVEGVTITWLDENNIPHELKYLV